MDTHAAETPSASTWKARFHVDWVIPVLIRPRKALAEITAQPKGVWLTPLVILCLTGLVAVLVGGPLRQQAALSGQAELPPDFQWYTPEQQAQFVQAQSASSGTAFVYVFPALQAVLRVGIGWLIVGALLHLALTLLGARGTMQSAMNLVAWAGLPFGVRDLVRTLYVLLGHRLIQAPGLSGLLGASPEGSALFGSELLALVDVYLVWHVALLVIGVRVQSDPGRGRAWGGVALTQAVALLLQALPAYLVGRLASLTIARPFFF